VYKVSRNEQLKHWQEQLFKYSGCKRSRPKDWFEAFAQLQAYLETKKDKELLVVFIDELPWMDTPKSGFIRALELSGMVGFLIVKDLNLLFVVVQLLG